MDLTFATTTGTSSARHIVQRVFRDYPGKLAVRLWDGQTLEFGEGAPEVTLVFHHPRPFRDLVLFADPLRLAEAYFRGQVRIEGDIYAALKLKDHLHALTLPLPDKATFLAGALRLRETTEDRGGTIRNSGLPSTGGARAHSRETNRAAIAFHYDISNAFYELWLDEEMVYSCAYFEDAHEGLDQAQRSKLDYICRKLRLRPGERLLDIGCGWGALICWAARHYGARAHGITLSHNQYEYALAKIADEGLQDSVTVELNDYRDMEDAAAYDKIVSVGMFEHVGLKNLPSYFDTVRRLLTPDGLFLNHGITHDQEGWGRTLGTKFINRYVFPDGQLDTVSNIQRVMERSGFEILDVEAWRPHYALTLRHWVQRLEARRAAALRFVPESVYRIWHLYMAACALQFEEGTIGVHQILAAKHGAWPLPVPLTRRDLYG